MTAEFVDEVPAAMTMFVPAETLILLAVQDWKVPPDDAFVTVQEPRAVPVVPVDVEGKVTG